MAILVLKTNNDILRVRKEEFGCVIFNREKYIEGNEMAYFIFEQLLKVEYDLDRLISTLLEVYDVDLIILLNDLKVFFQTFQEIGWFTDIYNELESRVTHHEFN